MRRKKLSYDRGPSPFPWRGVLTLANVGGLTAAPVLVVGTTRHKWRVQALQPIKLPSGTILQPGERALVPHAAVRDRAPDNAQQEFDLRQLGLEFGPRAARKEPCHDCDLRALQNLNGYCERHVTPESAGRTTRLEALRKRNRK